MEKMHIGVTGNYVGRRSNGHLIMVSAEVFQKEAKMHFDDLIEHIENPTLTQILETWEQVDIIVNNVMYWEI